jgi:hypothetical protein
MKFITTTEIKIMIIMINLDITVNAKKLSKYKMMKPSHKLSNIHQSLQKNIEEP